MVNFFVEFSPKHATLNHSRWAEMLDSPPIVEFDMALSEFQVTVEYEHLQMMARATKGSGF